MLVIYDRDSLDSVIGAWVVRFAMGADRVEMATMFDPAPCQGRVVCAVGLVFGSYQAAGVYNFTVRGGNCAAVNAWEFFRPFEPLPEMLARLTKSVVEPRRLSSDDRAILEALRRCGDDWGALDIVMWASPKGPLSYPGTPAMPQGAVCG